MNTLFKNKFLRENLILVIIFTLIFPPYIFSDAWVADTGNDQVSQLYKDGHAFSRISVASDSSDVGETEIRVNENPTALFYPGLKLSFGNDRKNVYEIQSIRFKAKGDGTDSWIVGLYGFSRDSFSPDYYDDVTDSPIYMELVRSGGFSNPVAVSTNQTNARVWIADDSFEDPRVTQLNSDGRVLLSDTGIVRPYDTAGATTFYAGEFAFILDSKDTGILEGMKIDFRSDNRDIIFVNYVLEIENVDRTASPYILTTTSGLPDDHSIIGKEIAIVHIDRFRDKTLISPKDVSANSYPVRTDPEYDIAWGTDTGDDSVVKFSQWRYRKPLYIDYNKIGENLEDFPIMVKLIPPDRIDYGKSTGADIRFTDIDGVELSYEIEKWDDGDTSIVWVKVPEVSSIDTTVIYMYYGNPTASSNESTEVWSNRYLMVQHFTETSGPHIDSTGNGNNSTVKQVTQQGADIGKVDGADEFNGTDNYIEIENLLNKPKGDFTATAWFRRDGSDTSTIVASWTTNCSFSNTGWQLGVDSDNMVKIYLTGVFGSSAITGPVIDNDWHCATVARYDSDSADTITDYKLYVDGNFEASGTGAIYQNYGRFYIGNRHSGACAVPGGPFNGIIDEVAVSDTVRSDAWIKAEYESVMDELITFGAEDNIRYIGTLKVGGFNSPKSISVNSSNNQVWAADTDDSCVVKLSKYGHQNITATVNGYYSVGEFQLDLSGVSELDSGIKISFDSRKEHAYTVNEGRGYRMKLVFNKIPIDEDLANFPVMVKLGDGVKFDYDHSTDDGADIRFFDPNGDKLSYEIEKWDSPLTSIIWVKVSNIYADSSNPDSDYIWMYYGNPNATDAQNVTDVWSNSYLMVQHLQETSGIHQDSTTNNKDATPVNFLLPGQQGAAPGLIDGADGFDNEDSSYLSVGGLDDNQTMWEGPLTVSALFKPDNIDTGTIVSWWTASLPPPSPPLNFGWQLALMDTGDTVNLHLAYGNNLTTITDGTKNVIDGNWHCAGFVRHDTEYKLYVDGVGGDTGLKTLSSGQYFRIGDRYNSLDFPNPSSPGGYFTGIIDEVRVSIASRSQFWMWAEYNSMIDNFIDYGGELDNLNSILIEPALKTTVRDGSSVARELARIYGFTNPVAVSVNTDSGDCWVADNAPDTDNADTVIWLNGDIGGIDTFDTETIVYDINNDVGYHRIITGFKNPVSISADDPVNGYCWVACEGVDGGDSYIVRLDKDVGLGGDYSINGGGNKHIKIYGFSSPSAVSVDPTTGECWVADKGNNQIVRLPPEGHRYTGYILSGSYNVGDTLITLSLDPAAAYDTALYPPLKVSFGINFTTDIKNVYEIKDVSYSGPNPIIKLASGLIEPLSLGTRLYKELARVAGFSSPSDVSAFRGPDLGEGIHPWGLEVRELYVVNEEKTPFEEDDGWKPFPANAPVHDATPQFRWKYIDVDGSDTPLKSYRIRIYTLNADRVFEQVWDSDVMEIAPAAPSIYPTAKIYTDWDRFGGTRENDSTSIYSAAHYILPIDLDDCPDLSQDENDNTDSGDKVYFVQLTVTNKNNESETFPPLAGLSGGIKDGVDSPDTPVITFIVDKTPPGAYRVCGTGVNIPATDDNHIKKNYGNLGTIQYYQQDNQYWDQVWVEWDGGETEIVKEDSPWIPYKTVTVRVKVKDKNNENLPDLGITIDHRGHNNANEFPEKDTDCSGVFFIERYNLMPQYRYSLATSPPPPNRKWSDWFNCDEVRLYNENAPDSQGIQLTMGGQKNTYVWLYAKNVKFDNGETNLIQFRIKDVGDWEVTKIAEESASDTAEVWIAPNMGYSHADTIIDKSFHHDGYEDVEYQTSSNEFGYQLQIDADMPEVILIQYPSNPFPHRYASFRWIGVDTSQCMYKWKLEKWDGTKWDFYADNDGSGDNYSDNNDPPTWNYDGTSTSFEGLQVGRWYRFWVKAKDRSGQTQVGIDLRRQISDDVIWVWYVSPEVPDTIITYSRYDEEEILIRWRGVGGTPPYAYQYRLVGDNISPVTSGGWVPNIELHLEDPFGIQKQPEGNYVFEVWASDILGGVDPTPARIMFTIVHSDNPPYLRISPDNLYKYSRGIEE